MHIIYHVPIYSKTDVIEWHDNSKICCHYHGLVQLGRIHWIINYSKVCTQGRIKLVGSPGLTSVGGFHPNLCLTRSRCCIKHIYTNKQPHHIYRLAKEEAFFKYTACSSFIEKRRVFFAGNYLPLCFFS